MASQGQAFKGHWKANKLLHVCNMLALAVNVSKIYYAPEMTKSAFSVTPLSFEGPLPWNQHERLLGALYCLKVDSVATFLPPSMIVYGAIFYTIGISECVMTLRGHLRSIIFMSSETSY